jgi:hypothetical protein
VISDICWVDSVIALLVEHAEPAASAAVHYCEVVEKVQRAVVEPDVIVRTQAQYVLRDVGTVMRPAKRTDVRPLSVGGRWNQQLLSTHLASITVQALDDLDHGAIANLALHHSRDTRNCPSRTSRRRNAQRRRRGVALT